jgi:uncharacterized protein YbcV (DUF1398 family)
MNSNVVLDVARATLAGTISFPDVVAKLLAEGVEYYHVDYAGLSKSFYGTDGARVVTPIPYEALPPIAPDFDATALKVAILASQTQGQSYRDFTIRAMTARRAKLLRLPSRPTRDVSRPQRRPVHGMVSGGEEVDRLRSKFL